jgi:hypothetical protein
MPTKPPVVHCDPIEAAHIKERLTHGFYGI